MTSYRIGVDVGGTNTDAVLMEGRNLVAKTKQPTSQDVTTGILESLKAVIADARIVSGSHWDFPGSGFAGWTDKRSGSLYRSGRLFCGQKNIFEY